MPNDDGKTGSVAEPTGASHPGPALNVQSHFSWMRTRLSAERTLMSWNRTSLSLIGFGFTIYQFFDKFQEATAGAGALRPEAPRNFGLAFVVAGTLGLLVATWQYFQVVQYLGRDEFKDIGIREGLPRHSLTWVVAIVSVLIGIATTIWMLARA